MIYQDMNLSGEEWDILTLGTALYGWMASHLRWKLYYTPSKHNSLLFLPREADYEFGLLLDDMLPVCYHERQFSKKSDEVKEVYTYVEAKWTHAIDLKCSI